MKDKFNQIIWVVIVLLLGLWSIHIVKGYMRDQNKIYAASEKAKCQIELMKVSQTDFSICQDIMNSTPRENSLF